MRRLALRCVFIHSSWSNVVLSLGTEQVTAATERTIKAELGWRSTRLLWLLVVQVILIWLVLRSVAPSSPFEPH